jgi:hypothetical protein
MNPCCDTVWADLPILQLSEKVGPQCRLRHRAGVPRGARTRKVLDVDRRRCQMLSVGTLCSGTAQV